MADESMSPLPPAPAEPISDLVRKAILAEGDQAKSAEIDLGGGITITAGLRNVYLNFDGAGVTVCPCVWR